MRRSLSLAAILALSLHGSGCSSGSSGGSGSARSAMTSAAPATTTTVAAGASGAPAASAATAPSGAPAASASAAAGADFFGEKKTFTLEGRDGVTVKVTFTPPKGWNHNDWLLPRSVVYQSSWTSHIDIGTTCHGNCSEDAAALGKNILAQAEENFAFLKSANHSPQLEAIWIKKPAEETKGNYFHRFIGKRDGRIEEEQISLDRILPKMPILRCGAELDERDPPGLMDALEKMCRELTFEVIPAPAKPAEPATSAAP